MVIHTSQANTPHTHRVNFVSDKLKVESQCLTNLFSFGCFWIHFDCFVIGLFYNVIWNKCATWFRVSTYCQIIYKQHSITLYSQIFTSKHNTHQNLYNIVTDMQTIYCVLLKTDFPDSVRRNIRCDMLSLSAIRKHTSTQKYLF